RVVRCDGHLAADHVEPSALCIHENVIGVAVGFDRGLGLAEWPFTTDLPTSHSWRRPPPARRRVAIGQNRASAFPEKAVTAFSIRSGRAFLYAGIVGVLPEFGLDRSPIPAA
ncbi:MAG: hypothetical protein KGM15_10405, partial [Pseudomonadota bacterium]|nr:hypothetical protein [Pseudomonadota bacterium]